MPYLATVNFTEIAALVTALAGLILGVAAARRGSKQDKTMEQTTLLEGYGGIVKDLQVEIARIRTQYTDDLAAWRSEKEILLRQIDLLQKQIDQRL